MLPEGPLRKVFSTELEKLDMYGEKPLGLDEYYYNKEVKPSNIGRVVHEYDKLVKKYAEPITPRFSHYFFLAHQMNRNARQEATWNEKTPYDRVELSKVAKLSKLNMN